MSTQTEQRPAERRPEPEERRPVAGVVVVLVVLAALLLVSLYVQRSRTETNRRLMTPEATVPTTLVPPALANTGDNPDWPALVNSWLALDYWLRLHPDSSRLGSLYAPEYRVVSPSGEVITLDSAKADMDSLARGDIRYDPAPAPLTAAVVTMQNRDAHSASVFVRYNPRAGNRAVGRDGTVTQFADEKGVAVIWRLVLGDDGRWRLAGVKGI